MKIKSSDNKVFNSIREMCRKTGNAKTSVLRGFKKYGKYERDGVTYTKVDEVDSTETAIDCSIPQEDNLEDVLNLIKNNDVRIYELKSTSKGGRNVAISLLSDIHIGESVKLSSTLGRNEFDHNIGVLRLEKYFTLILDKIVVNNCSELILGVLGDCISGWIHDELAQTNTMSPQQEVVCVRDAIISGIAHIRKHFTGKITFVGVYGNHGRTTRKTQMNNGWQTSFEYFMYKEIANKCNDLNVEFVIPESDIAVVSIENKNFLFTHGTMIRGNGGIGGITVPVNRWFAKINKVIPIEKAFIGHFHQLKFDSNVVINGSVIGYNAFALSNAFGYEKPQQAFCVYNTESGFTDYSAIILN